MALTKKKIEKLYKEIDPDILENILWFRKFTLKEKIEIYHKQRERFLKLKGTALKCINNISLKK